MDDAQESSHHPPTVGLKKVFSRSNRNQTAPQGQDMESTSSSARSNGRSSVDSTPEKRLATSGELAVEDSPNRLSKLLGNRKKKKSKATESVVSADSPLDHDNSVPVPALPSEELGSSGPSANKYTFGSNQSAVSINLLTDDSEPDQTPALVSRSSHTGYLTASSPLIKTTAVDNNNDSASASSGSPSRRHSVSEIEGPGFLGVTSTVSGPAPDNAKRPGVSPSRRLKDAFKPQAKKSPSVSPDRESSLSAESQRKRSHSIFGGSSRRSSLSERRAGKRSQSPPPPLPKPIIVDSTPPPTTESPDNANTTRTPTGGDLQRVVTKVTPPTPTETGNGSSPNITESPESIKTQSSEFPPGTVVSPSGHMISHRRVRSAGATSHPPSKLSQTTILTPTIEETRATGSRTPSGVQNGFFSSVLSVAQNAASTISSSLSGPNKTRSVTSPADGDKPQILPADDASDGTEQPMQSSNGESKDDKQKELAIDTLGSGDLDFSHLDVDSAAGGVVTTKDGVVITQPDLSTDPRRSNVAAKRDQMSARIEDMRVARAVSMAYEKSTDAVSTPATVTPEETVDAKVMTPLTKEISGEQTPPGGSIFDGENGGSVKRTGSVRSRLARRHRGSSGATGSTIGAMGLNAMSLAMPNGNANAPRLTGFAVASKKRNREYHQLFRSVPEDDFLIEDYSCALQRDIILAGRIYISEGHICFSSNILGFVTTLVISFDEIVAIEKENTAVVFPNAIAIQTLHSRHTFRSLLSREATYDLMVNIWKMNHPALRSYLNGMRIDEGLGDKTEKANESDVASDIVDEDEIYDEDEDNEGDSLDGGEDSLAGNGSTDFGKQLSAAANGSGSVTVSTTTLPIADTKPVVSNGSSEGDGSGFPGPPTHSPTDYTDPSGRYEKVIKEDIIPAPLGQVYSMVFGPASGAFMSKFLVEDQKSLELQFEDDKKGLNNANKTRQYSYIKPLYSSIGPKQTKCISNETLDLLDLEKAVLVTLATQTPDVPSGNVFVVKTKYLFTWAANNQTRFFMSCAIEWTGKSWLKGPIEKGAIDGQTTFGNDLIKALKAAVQSRAGGASKGVKVSKGRRKKGSVGAGETVTAAAAAASAALDANKREHHSWGIFEPLHGPLQPIVSLFKPFWSAHVAIGIIAFLLFTIYSKGLTTPSTLSPDINHLRLTEPQRLAAYEEMWRAEENELWKWLEDRVGMDGISFPVNGQSHESRIRPRKHSQKSYTQYLASKIDDEQISQREMNYAIRVVRDRLEKLEKVVGEPKSDLHTTGTPGGKTKGGLS
ncbi:hypothetical protein BGW36DRAFT_424738 [Talaromyces proteolyticus]|uniref:VASt domain-containing protein n=1 Tax=Talaromyces proteolyticus TaxID=1131652 RepID=A0AAD4KWF7_9EURO|nr:uncharacterized protein BGW36DRAFT_424738 [Talaromyces proteolyticus]KAH8702463.1 hypothetical protein BGW36DRAFT_424738 [Talaromyces proteolyticus]